MIRTLQTIYAPPSSSPSTSEPFHSSFPTRPHPMQLQYPSHPSLAPTRMMETLQWMQIAPVHDLVPYNPNDNPHLLVSQPLLSSPIGPLPSSPALLLPLPASFSTMLLPPSSAGLQPAVAALRLLGHGADTGRAPPAALTPDALRCLLYAAAAQGLGSRR